MTVDCEFSEECPLTSCVLIYREYENSTLTVIDYNPTTTVFPVTLTVDDPENFTFAIFGRNCEGELEKKPAKTIKAPVTTSPGMYMYMQYVQPDTDQLSLYFIVQHVYTC